MKKTRAKIQGKNVLSFTKPILGGFCLGGFGLGCFCLGGFCWGFMSGRFCLGFFVLSLLLKPDKLPSLTTSYRPISLISSIMKLFERVIEQRLRSYLENIGFLNKHQSGFRRAKSTYDHLFRLSQSIMESFNRREHVVALEHNMDCLHQATSLICIK